MSTSERSQTSTGITVAAAQAEVREVYLDGHISQLVSGVLWTASAAASR